jgi:hypothetical protein
VSTHTNTHAQHPRAAATPRHCTSSPTCHETAPQPLVKLPSIAAAAARLLPLTAAATVQCSAAPHIATQRHSDTATQHAHSTHCRSRKSKSNIHTDTQTHSATAAHTATLHTQHARHQGSNTQRRRGIAHPPTTASSSVQSSHSREHTQHLQHGVTVAAGSYTTAVRHCDCDMHDHRTRVALVRNMDCQRPTPPPPPTTQSCNRNTAAQHPTHCARDSADSECIVCRAYAAHKIHHIFEGPTRTAAHMPTSAALPDTITPQTHAMRRASPSTTARQRPDACHSNQRTPTTHATHIAHSHAEYRHTSPARPHDVLHRTNHCALRNHHRMHIAHSHAEYRHTSPARPHDVLHSTNHCALRNHHRMHTAARTPRTARHTAPVTPHAAHRKSHPVTHAASAPHSR